MQVTTEDGETLDPEAAAQGLTLRLAPPSSGRADELVLSPVPGASFIRPQHDTHTHPCHPPNA